MTDETPPTPPANPPDDGNPKPEDPPDIAKVRKEAAGYRTKLRETEQERDALTEQLTALRRAEVERVATSPADGFRPLVDAEDVWRSGDEVPLTDEGTVDVDAVRERVTALADEKPHLVRYPTPENDAGKGRGEKHDEPPSFGAAMKGAR